jgi:hypothetical protein
MTGQRKGAAIAMTDGERDAFLRTQPVCRVATLGPGGHPHALTGPEQLFADKYMGGGRFRYDGRHGWLRVIPAKIVSWDFAKLRH